MINIIGVAAGVLLLMALALLVLGVLCEVVARCATGAPQDGELDLRSRRGVYGTGYNDAELDA